MIKHFNIRFFGQVQGVGFRWTTLQRAGKLGIKGFVKNDRNGTLYIEAEGEPENLKKFIAWCKKGPLWARVENAEIAEGELKKFTEFNIEN